MSKTLGIPWNMWHGVFPAIAMPVVLGIAMAIFGVSQRILVFTMPPSILVLFLFQYVNEKIQSKGDLVKDYGSYENWLKNTRDDWKWFWFGIVAGLLLDFILFSILYGSK